MRKSEILFVSKGFPLRIKIRERTGSHVKKMSLFGRISEMLTKYSRVNHVKFIARRLTTQGIEQ